MFSGVSKGRAFTLCASCFLVLSASPAAFSQGGVETPSYDSGPLPAAGAPAGSQPEPPAAPSYQSNPAGVPPQQYQEPPQQQYAPPQQPYAPPQQQYQNSPYGQPQYPPPQDGYQQQYPYPPQGAPYQQPYVPYQQPGYARPQASAPTFQAPPNVSASRFLGSAAYHVEPQPGYNPPPQYPYGGGYQFGAQSGQRYSSAPQGTVMSISLGTAISTQVAKTGDYIQATLSQNVPLSGGYAYIPAGTVVVGTVTDAVAGRRLSRSGLLSIQFNQLRMPDGTTVPIQAHLMGNIAKYKDVGSASNDVYRGEGWGTKLGQTALRGLGGAGLGAGLGTAVGAIAGGGHGAGMGAWSGAAIGGGIGLADMLLRKGKDVIIPSGTAMQIQLDQPVTIASGGGGQMGMPQMGEPQMGMPPQGEPTYGMQ